MDAGEVTASTLFVFLSGASGKPEPVGMSRCCDTCRRTEEGWRLARRHVLLS